MRAEAGAVLAIAMLVALAPGSTAAQPIVYTLGHHEIVGMAAECITIVLPATPGRPAPALLWLGAFEGSVDGQAVAFDRFTWYAEDSSLVVCEFSGRGAVDITGSGAGAGVPAVG